MLSIEPPDVREVQRGVVCATPATVKSVMLCYVETLERLRDAEGERIEPATPLDEQLKKHQIDLGIVRERGNHAAGPLKIARSTATTRIHRNGVEITAVCTVGTA